MQQSYSHIQTLIDSSRCARKYAASRSEERFPGPSIRDFVAPCRIASPDLGYGTRYLVVVPIMQVASHQTRRKCLRHRRYMLATNCSMVFGFFLTSLCVLKAIAR